MKKLTGEEPKPEPKIEESKVIESKTLEGPPNTQVAKKTNYTTIILIIVIIVAIIGLGMLYNHYKNKNGNATEPTA